MCWFIVDKYLRPWKLYFIKILFLHKKYFFLRNWKAIYCEICPLRLIINKRVSLPPLDIFSWQGEWLKCNLVASNLSRNKLELLPINCSVVLWTTNVARKLSNKHRSKSWPKTKALLNLPLMVFRSYRCNLIESIQRENVVTNYSTSSST